MSEEAMKVWQDALLAAEHGDLAAAAVIAAAMEADKAEIARCHDVLRRLRDFDGWDGTFHGGHALDAKNDARAILADAYKPEAPSHAG